MVDLSRDSWSDSSEEDDAGDCSLTTGWTCWCCFFLDFLLLLCLLDFSFEEGDVFSSWRFCGSGVTSLVGFDGGRLLSLDWETAGDGVRSLRFLAGGDRVSFFLVAAGFSCGGGVSKRRFFTGDLDRDLDTRLAGAGDGDLVRSRRCFGENDFSAGACFLGGGDGERDLSFSLRVCFSKMSR